MLAPTEETGPDANEDLPKEVVAAIDDGLTALEAVRFWRRLSVEQLADRSGVSQAIIHGAEGGRELSLEARIKLAGALGVGADLIVE